MDAMFNRMRAEAVKALRNSIADPRMGIVTSYDPVRHAAKVKVMPEFADPDQNGDVVESGWLPIAVIWSGNGWGIYSPPTPGDQVMIVYQEHDVGSGVIIGRVYDASHLPLAVSSGEFWLVHQSGTFIKLTNDGSLTINGATHVTVDGPVINITATTVVNIDAPIINLAGGGPAVARVGDTVMCPAGVGHITTGSNITNSG